MATAIASVPSKSPISTRNPARLAPMTSRFTTAATPAARASAAVIPSTRSSMSARIPPVALLV